MRNEMKWIQCSAHVRVIVSVSDTESSTDDWTMRDCNVDADDDTHFALHLIRQNAKINSPENKYSKHFTVHRRREIAMHVRRSALHSPSPVVCAESISVSKQQLS